MQVPLQITFRNMESSEALEADIRKWVDKMERYHPDLISCRVVVEAPLQHHRKGGLFKVRIDMGCPKGKWEINREPAAQNQAHQDVYVAVRDAFKAAGRKLEGHVDRRKGKVKLHEDAQHGRITHLSPMEDYGLITTVNEQEIYFHRNSILNADLDSLDIGTEVHFRVEEGDKGPQASSVKVVEK
jgi:cold shock CspA family protein